VNSYVSLFYIAFLKGRINVFGIQSELCSPNCMTELTVQLGTIFLINMFVGQMAEVGLPWLKGKVSIFLEQRQLAKKGELIKERLPQAEEESKLMSYESTFDDFNEMAIQFGYCTLFAPAFPAAALAALLNNIVEIRTDALKLLKEYQRPTPRGANDIGMWFYILEVINYLSVITNAALIVYTSTEINNWFDGSLTLADKIWFAVLVEHFLFLFKWVLSLLIPDAPKWVRVEYARRQYWKERTLYNRRVDDEHEEEEFNRVHQHVLARKESQRLLVKKKSSKLVLS